METCQEHSKLTTQINDLIDLTKKVDTNVTQLLITTAENKIDSKWIKKELGKLWGVIMVIVAAIVSGAIKMVFFP